MCLVSYVGDWGRQTWPGSFEYIPKPWVPQRGQTIPVVNPSSYTGPTKEQFEEFLKLLRAAKKFDDVTGQPDCEQESKIGWLKDIAKYLGLPEPKL